MKYITAHIGREEPLPLCAFFSSPVKDYLIHCFHTSLRVICEGDGAVMCLNYLAADSQSQSRTLCACSGFVAHHEGLEDGLSQLLGDTLPVVADIDDDIANPLPILTIVGNGRGSGDYDVGHDARKNRRVGSWVWDRISIEDTKPKGYRKINTVFRF